MGTKKFAGNKELDSPQNIYESAKVYVLYPEELSSETRTILGHLYRDYSAIEPPKDGLSFADYALERWKEGAFPMDALV